MEVIPKENTGVPTVGVMVTVWVVVMGPLHPPALAVMTDVPLQPATQVTTPVPARMAFPAVMLALSSVKVIPVVFVAVAA